MMSNICRAKRYWTEEEDEILHREASWQLESLGAIKHWNQIASKLPGRTNKDCRKRWTKVSTNVKKGPWSPEEDDRLRGGVEQYGYCWTLVAQTVETRHADQCAKRWYHFLDPCLTHEQWDKGQDERLLAAVSSQGRCWKVISETEFPHRSPTDLKNRYIIIQRKMKLDEARKPKQPTTPTPTKHAISHSINKESADSNPGQITSSPSTDSNENIIPDDVHDFMFLDSLTQQQSTDGTSISADPDFSEFFPAQVTSSDPIPAPEISLPNLPPASSNVVDINNFLPLPGTNLPSALSGSGPDMRQDDAGKFTLELEDLEPETLNRIMSVLLTSREHLNIKFIRSHDV